MEVVEEQEACRRTLILKGPRYFSQGDEKAFFDWLLSISCVEGSGATEGLVNLKSTPGNLNFEKFIALLHRYRMDMKPLAALETRRNASWLPKIPALTA